MSLSSGMTIVELDDLIKSLPKERLQAELEKPTGHFPLYLVAGRLKEIESMTADAQAAAATEKAAEQPPSVAHRLAMMQPPVMSEVAAAPQPQPQPSPAGQAAQMLTPTVNANTGGLISELVNKYLADKKLKGTKDSDSEFAVPNSSGFAGGSSKQPFNKSNPTETGGLASLVAANVIRKERRADPTPDDGGVSKMRAGKFSGGVSGSHRKMAAASETTPEISVMKVLEELSKRRQATKKAKHGGYVGGLPTIYAQTGLDMIDAYRRRDKGISNPRNITRPSTEERIHDSLVKRREQQRDIYKRVGIMDDAAIDQMIERRDPVEDVRSGLTAMGEVAALPRRGPEVAMPPEQSETRGPELKGGQPQTISTLWDDIKNYQYGLRKKPTDASTKSDGGPLSPAPIAPPVQANNVESNIVPEVKPAGFAVQAPVTQKGTAKPLVSQVSSTEGGEGGSPLLNIPAGGADPSDLAAGADPSDLTAADQTGGPKVKPAGSDAQAFATQENLAAGLENVRSVLDDNFVERGLSSTKRDQLLRSGAVDGIKKAWENESKRLGEPIDIDAWRKDTKKGNDRAYEIFREIGADSKKATQGYIDSLKKDAEAIRTFAETGKLPKGRRNKLLNNILITFGASLLGNPTLAGALQQGLLGSLALQKGAEDDYAAALNDNLKATKEIGLLEMKSLEITNANKRGLISLQQADKKADTQTLLKLQQDLVARRKMQFDIQSGLVRLQLQQGQSEIQLMAAMKPNASTSIELERARAVNTLGTQYLAELDEAGDNRAQIQKINSRYKNVFPKKKDSFYLDVGNPLDKGVNAHLRKIQAPHHMSKLTTGAAAAATQRRVDAQTADTSKVLNDFNKGQPRFATASVQIKAALTAMSKTRKYKDRNLTTEPLTDLRNNPTFMADLEAELTRQWYARRNRTGGTAPGGIDVSGFTIRQ